MPSTFAPIQPGELITAEFMNRLIKALQEVESRLDALAGATASEGKPMILTLNPLDSVVMGDQLQVQGRHLSPERIVKIQLGTSPVTGYIGDERQISFAVPGVLGIPGGGGIAKLHIENDKGFDTTDVFVRPRPITTLDATFVVKNTQRPVARLEPNTPYDFTFTIDALTSLAATYKLEPKVTAPGWAASVKGEDTISIPASYPNFVKRTAIVTLTTGASGDGELELTVRATAFPGVTGDSDPVPVDLVNSPAAVNPDISFGPVERSGNNRYDSASKTVVWSGPTLAGVISVLAVLKTPTSAASLYEILKVEVIDDPGRLWKFELRTVSPFATTTANEPKNVDVRLTPSAGAPAATLRVSLRKQGSSFPTAVFDQAIRL